jgi:hypothetical protein
VKRKRIVLALLLLIAAVGTWTFFKLRESSLNYRFENSERIESVEYIPNFMSGRAFASGFDWDGETEEISVVIPDTVKFSRSSRTFRITRLGGFCDRGVPCQFGPMLPIGSGGGQGTFGESADEPELLGELQRRYPGAPVRDLRVRLHLGRFVSEIPLFASSLLYREKQGEGTLWRISYQVDCDESNQTFYVRDSKLYFRADDVPVTQLPYGED